VFRCRINPATDLLVQNRKRQGAIIQDGVVKGADIEPGAQGLLGSAALGRKCNSPILYASGCAGHAI